MHEIRHERSGCMKSRQIIQSASSPQRECCLFGIIIFQRSCNSVVGFRLPRLAPWVSITILEVAEKNNKNLLGPM
jgi:hypothetical protein